MPFCPKCGKEVGAEAEYCYYCGQSLPKIQSVPFEPQIPETSAIKDEEIGQESKEMSNPEKEELAPGKQSKKDARKIMKVLESDCVVDYSEEECNNNDYRGPTG